MRPAPFKKGGAKDGIEAAIDPFTEAFRAMNRADCHTGFTQEEEICRWWARS